FSCKNNDFNSLQILSRDNFEFKEEIIIGISPEIGYPPNLLSFFTDGHLLYLLSSEMVESEIDCRKMTNNEKNKNSHFVSLKDNNQKRKVQFPETSSGQKRSGSAVYDHIRNFEN
ncbi:hypothetical protein MHBO_005128, partial [Bonamia ostreae]